MYAFPSLAALGLRVLHRGVKTLVLLAVAYAAFVGVARGQGDSNGVFSDPPIYDSQAGQTYNLSNWFMGQNDLETLLSAQMMYSTGIDPYPALNFMLNDLPGTNIFQFNSRGVSASGQIMPVYPDDVVPGIPLPGSILLTPYEVWDRNGANVGTNVLSEAFLSRQYLATINDNVTFVAPMQHAELKLLAFISGLLVFNVTFGKLRFD